MTWPSWKKQVLRRTSRTIGLNVRGRTYPEVYRVCEDVYIIVGKMLSANEAIGPFSRRPRFDFQEVHFILKLLGAAIVEAEEDDYSTADLWISEG